MVMEMCIINYYYIIMMIIYEGSSYLSLIIAGEQRCIFYSNAAVLEVWNVVFYL